MEINSKTRNWFQLEKHFFNVSQFLKQQDCFAGSHEVLAIQKIEACKIALKNNEHPGHKKKLSEPVYHETKSFLKYLCY